MLCVLRGYFASAAQALFGDDPIDGIEHCEDGAFDRVGGCSRTAIRFSFVVDFNGDFTDGVSTKRCATNSKILANGFDARNFLDRPERRIDRSVPLLDPFRERFISVFEAEFHAGSFGGSTLHFVRNQSPSGICGAADLLLDESDNVTVENVLFLIGEDLELLEDDLKLFAIEMVSKIPCAVRERRAAAVFAQNKVRFRETDIFRSHDFVSAAILEHAVLVDPSLVRKRVSPDDRFVALHVEACDFGKKSADRDQPFGLDPRGCLVDIVPCSP